MINQLVPDNATGMRTSNGYTEWYKGDSGKGWKLISSDAPNIDSVDNSTPVVPLNRLKHKCVSKPIETQLLKQMYDFHITLLGLSSEEFEIFKSNNRYLLDKLIEDLKEK